MQWKRKMQENDIFDSIRKMLNFRNVNHSTDNSGSSGREIKWNRNCWQEIFENVNISREFVLCPSSTDSAVEISENLRANAKKNRAKCKNSGHGQKWNQSVNFRFVTRNYWVFKGCGDSLSKYDRIFELSEKTGFRTLACER